MQRPELAARQAQWARYRAWDESHTRENALLRGEAAIRAVGEMIEFYLEVSGGSAAAWRNEGAKVEAIRRVRQALRFAAPAR